MRNSIIPLSFVTTLLATTASADPTPTTQACLGAIDAFLTCPAGATRHDTECRAREPQRGLGANEHWSGSKRQGPAIFFRSDDKTVSFAANYKDHKKTGRIFRFDDQGRLDSWTDLQADQYNGMSVSCQPDGRVSHLSYYKNDRVVGISRAWKSDGSFSYAFDHDSKGRSIRVVATPLMQQRPDHLCQLAKCNVNAPPEHWK
jgi:hypothetical protein